MTSAHVRRLGAFERFRAVLHDLGFHHNVAIIARLRGPAIELVPLTRLVYLAVRHAINKHSALSVSVEDGDAKTPFFVHLPEIDLDKVVSIEQSPLNSPDETNSEQFLSTQNSFGFPKSSSPLWRVTVIKYVGRECTSVMDAAFIWHHVIGDGKSGLAALASIIQGMNLHMIPTGERGISVLTHDPPHLLHTKATHTRPALEDIMAMPTSWSASTHAFFKRWCPYWFRGPVYTRKWSGAPYTYSKPVLTKIKIVSLPETAAEGIIEHCRAESTTMTPLIQTLVGKVIMEAVPTADYLRSAIAISLRRFFANHWGIDDRDMGLFVSAFHIDVYRSGFGDGNATFWDQVRENGRHFLYEISKGDNDVSIGSLRHIDDFQPSLIEMIAQPRENSYGITNLGVFRPKMLAPQDDQFKTAWTLSDVFFSQSCHVNGSAIQFCIISTEHGPLNIALSWQEGVVDDELVAEIARRLKTQLTELGKSGGSGDL